MAKRRKIGQCVYCGEVKELTKDHVVPKSLFTPPFPPNLITVPACDDCNEAKAKNDDFLRDWLVLDIHGGQHPTAQKLFSGKVLRAKGRKQSRVAQDVVTSARVQPWYTPAGVYLGDFPMLKLDGERVQTTLSTIVRGLYYDALKQRMPDDCTFRIRRHDPWDFNLIWQQFQRLKPNQRSLGDVFSCAFVRAEDFSSWWLLWFYANACFTVEAERPPQVTTG